MNNQRIAARFLEIADQLELAGANLYRVRAYRRAARCLERLKDDVATLSQRGHLKRIPGIGSDLAGKILQFIESGEIPDPSLDQEYPDNSSRDLSQALKALIEAGALDPKMGRILHHRFYMESLDDLDRLVRSHLLRTLPNFGVQGEKKLLQGLETLKRQQQL